jgi:hypothetical protein
VEVKDTMNKRILMVLMVTLILYACASAVSAQVMPPGGPGGSGGNIYDGARSMYNKDGDLDQRIENYMARVRKGSVSYQQTKNRLYDYMQEARSRRDYWANNYSSSEDPQLYRAVDNMLSLQSRRCRELYEATVHEQENGYEAAKSSWQAELETYNSYKSAVRKVKGLL